MIIFSSSVFPSTSARMEALLSRAVDSVGVFGAAEDEVRAWEVMMSYDGNVNLFDRIVWESFFRGGFREKIVCLEEGVFGDF